MRYSEAIKELERDWRKVFESNSDIFGKEFYGDKLYLKIIGANLSIQDISGNNYISFVNLNRVWTEVVESVTWQEAFEAWAYGKTIRLVDKNGKEWFYKNEEFMELLQEEIITGIWYIEGDM